MSRPEFDGSYRLAQNCALNAVIVTSSNKCYFFHELHARPPRVCLREKRRLNYFYWSCNVMKAEINRFFFSNLGRIG